jgi:hypothetical protein
MATVRKPSSVAARNTRMAISLRLATSSFLCFSGWVVESIASPHTKTKLPEKINAPVGRL